MDTPGRPDTIAPLWPADALALAGIALQPARSESLTPDTVRTYQRRLETFLTWWSTHAPARPLDARLGRDFIAWVRGARESPTGHPPQPFSPLSGNLLLSAARRWCAALVQAGRLAENPFASIEGIRCPRRIRHRLLSSQDIRRILAAFRQDTLAGCRDYAIALLLLHGARETELIAARIGDLVDLGPDVGYELLVWSKGKHRQESMVLPADVRQGLDRYLARRFPDSRHLPAEAPLFAAHRGPRENHPMSARTLRKQIQQAVRRAGLQGRRISSLAFRFSGGAQAHLRGAPARSIQRMLRHESIRRTRVLTEQVDRIRFGAERFLDHLFHPAPRR